MNRTTANHDPSELAKFEAVAAEWWDANGPLKTLHDINPLRTDYIARRADLGGALVLDVGCGGGLLCESLARNGAKVSGIDLTGPALGVARRHAADSGLEIEYLETSAADLALERAATFDVVTCLELLEHVPDPRGIVAACAELVRPGGAVFFSTLNRNFKSFALAIVGAEYLLGIVPRGTHEYAKLIRPSELARWCRAEGLDLADLTGLHLNPLTQRYWMGGNADVNYFAHAMRAATT